MGDSAAAAKTGMKETAAEAAQLRWRLQKKRASEKASAEKVAVEATAALKAVLCRGAAVKASESSKGRSPCCSCCQDSCEEAGAQVQYACEIACSIPMKGCTVKFVCT